MRTLLATTALALCLGATSVHADMKAINTVGYWRADAGTSDGGYPQCMVETTGTGFDGSTIGMMIKYNAIHPTGFAYELYKGTWNIPEGQKVRVVLTIDNAPGRIFNAYQAGRTDMIEIDLENAALDPQTGEAEVTYLFNLLRHGNMLRITFPDGNEAGWTAPLEGANQTLSSMSNCIRMMAVAAERGQQRSVTTQPYGHQQQLPATQKTTQPYTPL